MRGGSFFAQGFAGFQQICELLLAGLGNLEIKISFALRLSFRMKSTGFQHCQGKVRTGCHQQMLTNRSVEFRFRVRKVSAMQHVSNVFLKTIQKKGPQGDLPGNVPTTKPHCCGPWFPMIVSRVMFRVFLSFCSSVRPMLNPHPQNPNSFPNSC